LLKKSNAPIVDIKDPTYKFSINPKIIELVEKNKFYGNDEEYPGDHIHVHTIANLYGNNDVLKQYYFVKLFPFSFGGDARNWYSALPPRSITSKGSCVQLFYGKYFPHSKIHAMKIDICKFAQRKEETILQAWGRFSKMTRNCPFHDLKDNELLDTFYNGLINASRSYIDSIAGNIFKNRTISEAKELWTRWLRIMITGLLMKRMILKLFLKGEVFLLYPMKS
jgi:hypothetical protein